MPVISLPEDKPKITFHAAMMCIQNFGFFIMYYDLWGATPDAEACADTRFAVGYMAISCFLVAFLCIGMGFGGVTDDAFLFAFYWIAHAVPAVGGYSVCTLLVPMARFSETGLQCAALAPVNGTRLQAVYILHAALYFCYVGNMLSVTFFSFLKPTFKFTVKPATAVGALVITEAIVFGALAQYGVFDPLSLPAPKSKLLGII